MGSWSSAARNWLLAIVQVTLLFSAVLVIGCEAGSVRRAPSASPGQAEGSLAPERER